MNSQNDYEVNAVSGDPCKNGNLDNYPIIASISTDLGYDFYGLTTTNSFYLLSKDRAPYC